MAHGFNNHSNGIRNSSISCDVQFIHDPEVLPKLSWCTDTLANSLLATPAFARVLKASLAGADIYHALFTSNHSIIGLALITELTRKLGPLRFRVAVIGNPVLSADCAIFTPHGIDRSAVIPVILGALKESMSRRSVKVLFLKEFGSDRLAQEAGFFAPPLNQVLGLELRGWPDFNAYLDSMKSHYRSLVTRAQRELEDVAVQEEASTDAIASRLHELFKTVTQTDGRRRREAVNEDDTHKWPNRVAHFLSNLPRRHQGQMIGRNFVSVLKSTFPKEANIITMRRGTTIIGCTVNLQDGDVFHSIFTGMEHDFITPYVYRILLASKVESAIKRQLRFVHFGREGQNTKSDFGSVALPERCYCYCSVPFINWILKRLAVVVDGRRSYHVPRKVFKAAFRDTLTPVEHAESATPESL